MKKILGILGLILLLSPHAAFANRAEVMMLPTRVIMENNERFTTVIIKNTGNATGDFAIDLIDMNMLEDGMVVPLEEGKQNSFSAIPYLRMAPKSMTLKPGEAQNVRIMLRKSEGMQAGEFRSHMRVRIVNDNVEETASDANGTPAQKEAGISVKTNLVLIIPIIIRNGETSYTMKIEKPQIVYDEKNVPKLVLTLLRDGNRSAMGDFTIAYKGTDGKTQIVKNFPGIPVYRPLNKRKVSIIMDGMPKGVDLSKGQLEINYAAQEKESSKPLAAATLDLLRP